MAWVSDIVHRSSLQANSIGGEWDLPGLVYFGDDDQHTAPAEHDFGDYTLEYPIDEELSQHCNNASGAKQSITQEGLDLPMLPRKQSIRSRKRNILTPSENNATKVHSSNDEPFQENVNEECENEYREVDTSCGEKAKNGKPKATQKRKNASAGPEASTKEPPKKKFSHTTRKNKLSKTWPETPGHEIDTRKMAMTDLIHLGEQREKRSKKDATTAKRSSPNQSVDNSFWEDADPDDPFATMHDLNSQEHTTTHPKPNYHSFQKRRPRGKWSKQDTELFFEALGQFGTDFSLIATLFPHLDDNPDCRLKMVKAKYKIEARKQPMRLHNALTNRSKNHALFELLIEKLPQSQEEQNSNEDMESVGVSAEAEDNVTETDENAENMDVAEVDSPVKNVHETEDETYCDFDGYEPY